MRTFCLLLLVFVALQCTEGFSTDYFKQYEEAQVVRFRPKNSDVGAKFVSWALHEMNLDLWLAKEQIIDVFLPRGVGQQVFSKFPNLSESELFIENVAEKMREQLATRSSNTSDPNDPSWFLAYHTNEEIVSFMDNLVSVNPQLVKSVEIGRTVQNNAIRGVVIGKQQAKEKRQIFFTGCIHAREWISAATMQYLMQWLVSQADQPNGLLDEFDWVIVPVVNVDGYLWTWSNDRMWRKNRQPNNLCYGVDNNRNFDFEWGTAGSSKLACMENFQGPSPSSEPETQAVQSYIDQLDNLVCYADIHAYGQLWMTPWGWTSALPPTKDYDQQIDSSRDIVKAIYAVHQKNYTFGPISTTIYPASGSSADYAYGNNTVVLSYAVELRGTSNSEAGFLLPPNEIIPQGQEFVAGIVALVDYINKQTKV